MSRRQERADRRCKREGHALWVDFEPDEPPDGDEGLMVLHCWERCWVDGKYVLILREDVDP